MGATFKKQAITLTFFFISGAFSAVLGNVLYNQKSTGLHNVIKKFQKPWFQGWSMFLAMTLLIFDTPASKSCACPSYTTGGTVRGWGLFRNVAVPACCDMFATILQNISLLYLPPSVWQMTRGSILLFTAIITIFYRKKSLHAVDWIGVATTIIGITVVGVSSILSGFGNKTSSGMMIVAMLLVVLAQGLQALQTCVEEMLLHDVDATENEIVSFEGIWGLYLSTFIMLPMAQVMPEDLGEGIFENSFETALMISNSWPILFVVIGYMLAILIYNLTGMIVTSFSSAIHRNIYEALRSAAVWVLSVIVYYLFPSSGAGEGLSWMSLLQLAGFAVSIMGSFIYNRVIRIPGLTYENEVNDEPLMENK